MKWIERLKAKARELKQGTEALYHALKHPGTPWYAKLVLGLIVAYMVSPIDLIPDFIPVLGLLDEVILLPFFISLAIRLIPGNVWQESRLRASVAPLLSGKKSWIGALLILLIWLGLGWLIWRQVDNIRHYW
ncbi:YkvA family protein [Nibrella saemangeumensis]|uniref:YkvA family protein n=1 Tax=Nibrella saemangeumensis TaxID=1084526 RepID=A0ABP8N3E9_9BACT